MNENSYKEEEPRSEEKFQVGTLSANTIVLLDSEYYRVSGLEAGPCDVQLEKVEFRDGEWKKKINCFDLGNKIVPSDTLVVI